MHDVYFSYRLEPKKQKRLKTQALILATLGVIISLTFTGFSISSLMEKTETAAAVKTELTVVTTFDEGRTTKTVLQTPEGKRFAINAAKTQATFEMYKISSKPSGISENLYSQVGNDYYSTKMLHTDKFKESFGLTPIMAIIMSILAMFNLALWLFVYVYAEEGTRPSLEKRDTCNSRDLPVQGWKTGTLLYLVIPMFTFPSTLSILSCTYLFREETGAALGAFILGIAVTLFVTLITGWTLLATVRPLGLCNMLAARLIWGKAKNAPAWTYGKNPNHWPNTWVKKQKVDEKTLEALNPQGFNGTLKDLVSTAKQLGPDK